MLILLQLPDPGSFSTKKALKSSPLVLPRPAGAALPTGVRLICAPPLLPPPNPPFFASCFKMVILTSPAR